MKPPSSPSFLHEKLLYLIKFIQICKVSLSQRCSLPDKNIRIQRIGVKFRSDEGLAKESWRNWHKLGTRISISISSCDYNLSLNQQLGKKNKDFFPWIFTLRLSKEISTSQDKEINNWIQEMQLKPQKDAGSVAVPFLLKVLTKNGNVNDIQNEEMFYRIKTLAFYQKLAQRHGEIGSTDQLSS